MSSNVFRSGVIFKVTPHFVQVAIGRHFVFISSQATLMLSLGLHGLHSPEVHGTIPKGIVGGFEFTVLQRNLKELA